MSRIQLSNLSFHYQQPYVQVFERVSIEIDSRWRTGVVGRNGTGKSTLLGLISGRLEPTGGSIERPPGTVTFPYAPPDAAATARRVVLDAAGPYRRLEETMERTSSRRDPAGVAAFGAALEEYQRRGGYEIEARIERECHALGLDSCTLDRPFVTLSGGERTRALIAALFLREGVFPLIDEPTNHLDVEGRERLGDYLSRQRGFVLVSHDRHLLDRAVDHIVAINRADVAVHQTDYSGWRRQMELSELHEQRRHENLTREVAQLEVAARKRRTWSHRKEQEKRGAYDKGRIGHLAARQMKRALHIERRRHRDLEERKALLRNAEKERTLRLREEAGGPRTLLQVQDLEVVLGGRTVLERISLSIQKGERVAVVGPNGCGKTVLVRAIAGELTPSSGIVRRRSHVTISRAYQEPLWQSGYLRDHLRDAGLDEVVFRRVMGSLHVTGDVFERPLETFSLGQRKKVDLCRSFAGTAHLFVWDEPLNEIDIATREAIESAILTHEPTLLVVEHDRRFVERVATRVLRLPGENGRA